MWLWHQILERLWSWSISRPRTDLKVCTRKPLEKRAPAGSFQGSTLQLTPKGGPPWLVCWSCPCAFQSSWLNFNFFLFVLFLDGDQVRWRSKSLCTFWTEIPRPISQSRLPWMRTNLTPFTLVRTLLFFFFLSSLFEPPPLRLDLCGVDVGFENPIFAALEVDYSEADQDPTGEALETTQKVRKTRRFARFGRTITLNNPILP